MLKIVLPKSLDGDSAGGVVIPTPPVLSTAEALFNSVIERPTDWPAAICFSLRGAETVSLPLHSSVLRCPVSQRCTMRLLFEICSNPLIAIDI